MGAGWTLYGGELLLRWGRFSVRLSIHLNLILYYLTSHIVLVAFLPIFFIHSNQLTMKEKGRYTSTPVTSYKVICANIQ